MSSSMESNGYWKRFRPVDIATLAYIALEFLLVLIFMAGRQGWLIMLLFYFAAACIVFLMVAFPLDEKSFPWRILRVSYPMILFIFFYKAIGPQIFLIFDKPFDWMVHKFELNIFGIDPAFAAQRYIDIWLNEFMNFGYFTYYFLLPTALVLFIVMKKWNSLEKMILSSAITFYICYLIFIFYPVTGPRFYLEQTYYLPIIGPLFTPLTRSIVDFGGHYGAAMPSSHCAIALIVSWRVGRDIRELAVPAVLISFLLCISTVYGRFHYLTDVFAGLIIGFLGLWIASRWFNGFLKKNGSEAGFTA